LARKGKALAEAAALLVVEKTTANLPPDEEDDTDEPNVSWSCREGKLDPNSLELHSDNGKPMRASTLIATLQWLSVIHSVSRPHVSDDNPYSEALFQTLKHTPAYPRLPFATLLTAQRWMARFVDWYNGEHRHSAISYVTPDERHTGREPAILERRHRLYQRARALNPKS